LKGRTFSSQREAIDKVIREFSIERGGIDSSGLGRQLAEEVNRLHPLIRPIYFTNEAKERLAVTVKRKMEERLLQIPDDRDLVDDIHSIKKLIGAGGRTKFDAVRTKEGHSDRFWALALALDSASSLMPIVEIH
jgi:phage FluMu gp28-like protein